MSKFFWFTLGVVAIGGALVLSYLILRPRDIPILVLPSLKDGQEVQPSVPGRQAVIHDVRIVNGQFDPKVINVKAGETVRWTNLDGALHWPASNPHPTHTNVPGLDALGDLAYNETYAYTFERPGEYFYHDHTQARETGKEITGLVNVTQ